MASFTKKSPQLTSYDHSMETTWELSLDNVRKRNPLSERLLKLWAYFDNQDIWFQLLQKAQSEGPEWLSEIMQDEIEIDWTMQALCENSLIMQEPDLPAEDQGSRGYSIHGCVHDWTIHTLNGKLGLRHFEVDSVLSTTQHTYQCIRKIPRSAVKTCETCSSMPRAP